MPTIVYGNRPETILRQSANENARKTNHVLMGTWLEVVDTDGQWLKVKPRSNRGRGGWVHQDDVRSEPALKIFFVDVGQGDGAIVESPSKRLLIDGGPGKGFYNFLKHRYRPIFDLGEKVHFDAMIVSHPDTDHYRGLTHALKDSRFTFGKIFHNGIIRYDDDLPSGQPFDLGRLSSVVKTLD